MPLSCLVFVSIKAYICLCKNRNLTKSFTLCDINFGYVVGFHKITECDWLRQNY